MVVDADFEGDAAGVAAAGFGDEGFHQEAADTVSAEAGVDKYVVDVDHRAGGEG